MAYINESDTIRFMNLLGSVGEVFNKELSPLVINLYENILSEYPIADVEKAYSKAITTCRFFPKPVEILEYLKKPQVTIENNAEIEAEKVLMHLRHHGSTKDFNSNNSITNRLMSSRWQYRTWASNVLEKDLTWWKKEFVESFKAFSESETVPMLAESRKAKVVELMPNLTSGRLAIKKA